MIDRFRQLPASLAEHARVVRLGGTIPALMCHPDWISPLPTVLWMHGRTAYKEIDSGRFSRLLRAGIASVAIDLGVTQVVDGTLGCHAGLERSIVEA